MRLSVVNFLGNQSGLDWGRYEGGAARVGGFVCISTKRLYIGLTSWFSEA
jgi:hypothetical protein